MNSRVVFAVGLALAAGMPCAGQAADAALAPLGSVVQSARAAAPVIQVRHPQIQERWNARDLARGDGRRSRQGIEQRRGAVWRAGCRVPRRPRRHPRRQGGRQVRPHPPARAQERHLRHRPQGRVRERRHRKPAHRHQDRVRTARPIGSTSSTRTSSRRSSSSTAPSPTSRARRASRSSASTRTAGSGPTAKATSTTTAGCCSAPTPPARSASTR